MPGSILGGINKGNNSSGPSSGGGSGNSGGKLIRLPPEQLISLVFTSSTI